MSDSAENDAPVCVIRERIGPPPRTCKCSLVTAQGGVCAYGPRLGEACVTPRPLLTEERQMSEHKPTSAENATGGDEGFVREWGPLSDALCAVRTIGGGEITARIDTLGNGHSIVVRREDGPWYSIPVERQHSIRPVLPPADAQGGTNA